MDLHRIYRGKVLLVSNLVMKFKKNKLEMYIKCSSSRFGTLILFFFMYFPANEKSINERKLYTISYGMYVSMEVCVFVCMFNFSSQAIKISQLSLLYFPYIFHSVSFPPVRSLSDIPINTNILLHRTVRIFVPLPVGLLNDIFIS